MGTPLFKTGAAPQKNFGFMQFQKVLFDPQIIASAELMLYFRREKFRFIQFHYF